MINDYREEIEYETRLTTNDNPYDPFDEFVNWYLFDVEKGYDTCSKLARLINIKDDMTDQEREFEILRVYDLLIELDFLNIYKKVFKKV